MQASIGMDTMQRRGKNALLFGELSFFLFLITVLGNVLIHIIEFSPLFGQIIAIATLASMALTPFFGVYSLIQTLRTSKEGRPRGALFTAIATTIIGFFIAILFIGAIFIGMIALSGG